MKNLLLLIFLFFSIVVSGQDFSIGINGGALFSSVQKTEPREDINIYKESYLKATLGLNAELRLFNNFFGVLEVNYEEKGFAEYYYISNSSVAPSPPESLFKVDNKSFFNYISLPILVRYKYGRKINIYGSAGFSPSVLVEAGKLNSELPLAYNTKRLDVSGIFDAGLELNLSSNFAINWGARYNQSITHHNKYPRPIDGGELRHITYSFYGGIKFFFK